MSGGGRCWPVPWVWGTSWRRRGGGSRGGAFHGSSALVGVKLGGHPSLQVSGTI